MVCKKSVNSFLEPPNPTQLELILRDTNEINEEKLQHNLKLITEWIKYQPHFPKNIDIGLIRAMLRGNKHFVEKAKQKLERHLAAKNIYKDIYLNRSVFSKDIVQAMDVITMAPLPRLTKNGYRLYVFRLNRYDPAELNLQNAFKLFFMIYDLVMCSDIVLAGDIAIFDASYFSAGHLTEFLGNTLYSNIALLREAYAIRLKEIHIINAPNIVTKITTTIKPLLHPKVKNSMFIYENTTSMIDAFGAECLPSNYGGKLKSLREISTDFYQALNDNAGWFEAQEHVKITEIPKNLQSKFKSQDQCGIEGSFRKLNID